MTRTAADIGAGLAPAREARPIRRGERIHVVGAAGAGASAAALLALEAGAIVTGCDSGGSSPYTPALEAAGIPVAWGHDPSHATTEPPPDRLAVTKALTAIAPDHPELVTAARRGIPIEPWQQVVADAAAGRTLVAVAGTHGKSTTAGWLTHVLVAAGLDPGAFVGALLPASITDAAPATARLGRGALFVVEADEYAGNFDPYRPSVVALTTVEWDHPDVFEDRAAVIRALAAWLARVPDATIVANSGDPGVRDLLDAVQGRVGTIVTAALGSEPADLVGSVVASDRAATTVELSHRPGQRLRLRVPLAGVHNAANALVVAATALELGVEPETVAAAIGSFDGVGRRLERKGEAGGVVVYDDYGHHPSAIRATIEALRQREPGRRLWAVYEPLTYHRTAALLDDFAMALATADAIAIADIWAGRDPDTTITSPEALVAAIRARRPDLVAEASGSVEATAAWLASQVRDRDAVLVMGGGRSYRIAELLLAALSGAAS